LGSIRSRTIVAVGCLLLAATCTQAAVAAVRIAPEQEVVTLLRGKAVRARPHVRAKASAFVDATRPITGERTVLPVLAQSIDNHGRAWLRVRLPGRVLGGSPPPQNGWIEASHTLLSTTPWHLVVRLSARQVIVYRDGRRLRSYPAIVGKPSTPTHAGEYFVEESVQLGSGGIGGPYALATSDRSSVFHQFDGGPGQIAIHGLDNLGGQLGTAESHGCVRLADGAVTWLVERISPGVPVTIIP
ncbi:MAG TPA: L,D-transpeptidase, partial [Solirubrobacteraceae bacterium]|nr:L,D-transpeptidase [Solirubrobacteraceae bacterium]